MDDELSMPEAAKLLGVTHTTITNMVKRGDLVIAREEVRGRQRRTFVRRESVEAFQRSLQGKVTDDG